MINLNAVYCQRCDEMYITEGTYNAFISDKDKNKMETEFVLDKGKQDAEKKRF